MGFLYPLFLLAAATLAIPVLIHLFNLRRYKTVLFPHTRFLKNIQLRSRRQSQVRYKWLLALRLLFLSVLILAFAQPFFSRHARHTDKDRLQVIYIDNSPSMDIRKGARSLLEIACDAARRQVNAAGESRFLLLTNDRPVSYEPMAPDKVLAAIGGLETGPARQDNTRLLTQVQSLLQSNGHTEADVYYYSDFQRNAFVARPDPALLKGISFHAIAVQAPEPSNISIDTAFLNTPVLQNGQAAQLIVRSRLTGKAPAETPVLQLSVGGQTKSAASLSFTNGVSTDTLGFSVNDAGWQRLSLSVNDAGLRFDDTFRIAARSTPGLSVLLLNERAPNPFIQAAFRSNPGFNVTQQEIAGATADWSNYNLVIFNGLTRLDESTAKHMGAALAAGQSICIFPGRTSDLQGLNNALRYAGDIRFEGIDSSAQPASTLQQGSDLVKDLFEHIPDNVQLPVATWHYRIRSGFTANAQLVLSFRNGDAFFARYSPSRGLLYLSATSADLDGGNFPSSYFFAPFLYQMAARSTGGNIYALTAGAGQPAYLPVVRADDRNMIHLYGGGLDAIPPQQAAAGGVNVFVDAVAQQPGFYRLSPAGGGDSAVVALNVSRAESVLDNWDITVLKKEWPGKDASWQTADGSARGISAENASFPLWKVCIILALLLLAAETWLLSSKRTTQTISTP